MKTCSKCGLNKPLTDFDRQHRTADSYDPWCKPCSREYNREWGRRNPDKKRAYNLKWAKIRYEALQALKAVPCQICEQSFHFSCMEFHHIDPSLKNFGLGGSAYTSHGLERLLEEAAKCAVLCANCHRHLEWKKRKGREIPALIPVAIS